MRELAAAVIGMILAVVFVVGITMELEEDPEPEPPTPFFCGSEILGAVILTTDELIEAGRDSMIAGEVTRPSDGAVVEVYVHAHDLVSCNAVPKK